MRIKTSWNTSLTKAGKVRVTTKAKAPMLPAVRTSTTFGVAPPKKRSKKR